MLVTGSTGSVIRGLSITGFVAGVVLSDDGNFVERNWIGVGIDGTPGPNTTGVVVNGNGNTVGRENVISNNTSAGVSIAGSDNIVIGNIVGLDPSGGLAAGNLDAGVTIGDSAARNRIGGTDPLDRNVISGNAVDGIRASGAIATVDPRQLRRHRRHRREGDRERHGNPAPGQPGDHRRHLAGGRQRRLGQRRRGYRRRGLGRHRHPGQLRRHRRHGRRRPRERRRRRLDRLRQQLPGRRQRDLRQRVCPAGRAPASRHSSSRTSPIQGNRIGTTAAGSAALPNSTGIALYDTEHRPRRRHEPGQGNVISGNEGPGLVLPCFEFPGGAATRPSRATSSAPTPPAWPPSPTSRASPSTAGPARSSAAQSPAPATSSPATTATASSTPGPTRSSRATGSVSTPTGTPWATRVGRLRRLERPGGGRRRARSRQHHRLQPAGRRHHPHGT